MAEGTDRELIHRTIERLQQLTELFEARRQQLARAVGLTEQQWRVLEEISTEHFIPSLFARDRESSAAAVSKVLRQLIDKELVRVSISDKDARQRDYELSDAGKRVMSELRQRRQHAIDAIWRGLPERDLTSFEALGAELVARIQHYAKTENGNG